MKNRTWLWFLAIVFLMALMFPHTAHAADPVEINEENFPDEAFRNSLKWYDFDNDGFFSEEELKRVTSIYCSSRNITTIKGVEFFTELTILDCSYNQLTSIDVSKNTALESLDCAVNPLTSLDVTHNPSLTRLQCGITELTSLDVSKNTKLKSLQCTKSQLTSLDLSSNKELEQLECKVNQLTSLDLSSTPSLTSLNCSSNLLTELVLGDNKNLASILCSNNQLTSLDISRQTGLNQLYCNDNKLTALNTASNPELYYLEMHHNPIKVLDISCNDFLKKVVSDPDTFYETDDHIYYYENFDDKMLYFSMDPDVILLPDGNPFSDVKEGKFYYVPVMWAFTQNPQVTGGTDAAQFSPSKVCTRGEVVTFLWRAKGCPEPQSTKNPFKDVKEGKFYYKAVLWAVENNITTGTSTDTFSPGESCSRGQVVTFLWRTEGSPKPTATTTAFTDVNSKKFYYQAMLWAVENNITTGTSPTTFEPNTLCNRGQVVTFLYRDITGNK